MSKPLIIGGIYAAKMSGVILICLFCLMTAAAQVSDKDKQAEAIYDEAVNLIKQSTVEAVQTSLPKFVEARRLFREAGNNQKSLQVSSDLAILLKKLGDEYLRREDFDKAADFYRQALPYHRETENRAGEAGILHNLGFIADNQKEPNKAREFYEQALTAYRETENPNGEMTILSNLAALSYGAKDYQRAANFYGQALVIARQQKNRAKESQYLKSIGDSFENLKDYEKSALYFAQALPICRELKDTACEASSLHSIGFAASQSNDYKKAAEYYEQAIKAYNSAKNKKGEGIVERNFGAILFDQKDYADAAVHYEKSLALKKETGDRGGEVFLLADLGDTYSAQRKFLKSIAFYEQSLVIFRELKDLSGEFDVINKLGESYSDNYEPLKTVPLYERALEISRELKNTGDEAQSLLRLGRSYTVLNRYAEAETNISQAVALMRRINNEGSEIYALLNFGILFQQQYQYDKARAKYEESLTIARRLKDRRAEAYALNALGDVYAYLNQSDKAFENAGNAQTIFTEINDDGGRYAVLTNLGNIYYSLSRYDESLKKFEQSLQIGLNLSDPGKQADAMTNIALVNSALGQYEKSFALYEKVLVLARKNNFKNFESVVYNNIGYDYYKKEDYEKAKTYLEKSIVLLRELKANREEGYALHNLGLVFYKLKNYDEALKDYDQALKFYLEAQDRRPEAFLYDSYGEVYRDTGKFEKAAENLEKSLILSRKIKYQNVEANALTNLMRLWETRKQPRLAAFYGKQAVNVYQTIRGGNRNLDKESQKSFLQSNVKTYRELADLLIAQGRLLEAQQILDMLKEEEFSDFVRRDASEVEKLSQRADLTSDEAAALNRYQTISVRVTEIGLEFGKLQDKKNQLPDSEKLSPEEQKRYDELVRQLEDATATFQVFLRGLSEEFAKKPKVVQEIQENTGLQTDLKTWGSGIVALYTVVGDERYRVIVTTPDAQTDGKTEITAEELNAKIAEFRQAVQNPNVDPRPLGKELYDILIKPIEKQLNDAKAKTLLWSLDGTLRYLPLAALWDGKEYFGQKYENVVITLASRTRLGETVSADWRVLGLGVTDAKTVLEPNGTEKINFNALPAVRNELKAIINDDATKESLNGVLPGTVLLNENFTEAALKDRLSKSYQVIHIASHFSFRPGNETKSFLLLGDGNALSLVKVRTSPQLKFKGVELLTLSACQTAVGETDATGREIESFGEIAQQNGAKAVLATLWSVADESTQILMSEFYRIRTENPKITKSEAMQLAQKELLNGKYTAAEAVKKRSELIDLSGKVSKQPPFTKDPNAPFAHPFYWSPFVLIGNWR